MPSEPHDDHESTYLGSTHSRGGEHGRDRGEALEGEFPGESGLGEFSDRFRVVEVLGQGGFGTVYRAFDRELRREVAIKVARPERRNASDKLLREAQAAARLRHPHVVRVYDVLQDGDRCLIISELMDGGTLGGMLRAGTIPPRQAVRLLLPVIEAVQRAHQLGLIHRDIKPSNLLVDENRQLALTDFGLSRSFLDVDLTNSDAGDFAGTPAFMAPEQVRGAGEEIDARTDVHGLGATLYCMLTGKRPFGSGSPPGVLDAILRSEPTPPRRINPQVPVDLEAICLKALANDPDQRYPTALAMAEDLRRFLESRPIQARRAGPARRLRMFSRRHRVPLLAVALTLAALLPLAFLNRTPSIADPPLPVRRTVLETIPPGAVLTFVRVDPLSDQPLPETLQEGRGGEPIELIPATYVVTAFSEEGFQETRRVVGAPGDAGRRLTDGNDLNGAWRSLQTDWRVRNGIVHLPTIEILPTEELTAEMAYFEGGTFPMGRQGSAFAPEHQAVVEPYYLDTREVTWGEVRRVLRTRLSNDRGQRDDSPAVGLNFYQVAEIAERIGKRLMTEMEYEFAATAGGRFRFPWGNESPPDEPAWTYPEWIYDPTVAERIDRTETVPPVIGLLSGPAEWTATPASFYPTHQVPNNLRGDVELRARLTCVTRGGGPDVAAGKPASLRQMANAPWGRAFVSKDAQHPNLGFRCARSAEPRFPPPRFRSGG